MSNTMFYHDFTSHIVNITEKETVTDRMAEGHYIMYSRSGSGLLYDLTDEQIKEFAEEWANRIVEEYKEDDNFMNLATAYSQIGIIHGAESVFRQYALPILDLHFKSK